MPQNASYGILEAAFSVEDIRGLFAVAESAILRLLGSCPKKLSPPSSLTVRSEAVLLVNLITPNGERLQLTDFEL